MTRTHAMIAAVVVLIALSLGAVRNAEACSCVGAPPESYFDSADTVILVRAVTGPSEKSGVQRFDVLATLKGDVTGTYEMKRVPSPCDTYHEKDAVAFLFLNKGSAGLCSGNFGMTVQLPWAPKLFKKALGKKKPGPTALGAVAAALRAGLKGYTHGRSTIGVGYAPLAGKSFTMGKSRLSFKKTATRDSVTLSTVASHGGATFVEGAYATEGLVFTLLVAKKGDAYEVLANSVAER